MKKLFLILCFSFVASSFFTVMAAKDPIYTSWFGAKAISGYDPVAYFTESKPVEGKKEFSHTWMGAEWNFSSAENLKLFQENPEKYAPQYGGYCAYAVSQGSTASTVPEAWDIKDGKLYLNYSLGVRKRWGASKEEYIQLANDNWPEVLQ